MSEDQTAIIESLGEIRDELATIGDNLFDLKDLIAAAFGAEGATVIASRSPTQKTIPEPVKERKVNERRNRWIGGIGSRGDLDSQLRNF